MKEEHSSGANLSFELFEKCSLGSSVTQYSMIFVDHNFILEFLLKTSLVFFSVQLNHRKSNQFEVGFHQTEKVAAVEFVLGIPQI